MQLIKYNPLWAASASVLLTLFGQAAVGRVPGMAAREILVPQRASQRTAVGAMRAFINSVMIDRGLPGLSIALAVDGDVIWQAGFGFADVASAKRTSVQTVFRAGSIAKLYTATAVMQLVEAHALALDDPINRYLPFTVVNPLGERDITIRDLMTHRSGLAADAGASSWGNSLPLASQLAHEYATAHSGLFGGTVPRWRSKVGVRWEYSNLGVATLGLIVESANPDHANFTDYVQRRVLAPLGMRLSQVRASARHDATRPDILAQLSTGYARMGAALIPSLPVFFSETPAAEMLTRPADHIHLLMAMLDGGADVGSRILTAPSVAQMLTPTGPTEEDGVEQGLIWQLSNRGTALESFGHAGGHVFGWRMYSRAWPRYRSALVIAVNQWSLPTVADDVERIERYIEQWLPIIAAHLGTARGLDRSAYEVSYVRGALAAAMYQTGAGVSGRLPAKALLRSALNTKHGTGSKDDWDPAAYLLGAHDMAATGFGIDDVRRFWRSEACRVKESTVRLIYQELGGRFEPNALDDLFLPPVHPTIPIYLDP